MHHVRPQDAPPSLAIRPPLPPLWLRLPAARQQAVLRLLSELIQRRLGAAAGKEVADEPR